MHLKVGDPLMKSLPAAVMLAMSVAIVNCPTWIQKVELCRSATARDPKRAKPALESAMEHRATAVSF